MVYSKHTPKSRKYKKSESISKEHNVNITSSDIPVTINHALPPAQDATTETPNTASKEKKSPPVFGFLSSLFGSGEKTDRGDRGEKAVFNIMGHDIYFDDLILAGLILLLLTEKIDDEVLLIVLAYLLLDIF